jgi:hypothetical protein
MNRIKLLKTTTITALTGSEVVVSNEQLAVLPKGTYELKVPKVKKEVEKDDTATVDTTKG